MIRMSRSVVPVTGNSKGAMKEIENHLHGQLLTKIPYRKGRNIMTTFV